MRKLILGILTLSLMLVMIGSVSADTPMSFIHPESGVDYVTSSPYTIEWENPSPFTSASLQYKEGSCSGDGWSVPLITTSGSETSYNWTLPVSDGIYCLRFQVGSTTLVNSGLFTIDREVPTVEANGPYTCDEGSSVLFDSEGTSDSGSGIESYEWTVDGDVVSTASTYNYTCEDDNVYDVVLTVTDYAGNSDTDDTTVTINEVDPVASFNWLPASPNEGQEVQFTDTSSSYDAITDWAWDFDDDGLIESTEQNPEYIYTDSGIYTVTLTVTDDDGSVSIPVSHEITVRNIVPVITNLPASENTVANAAFTFDVDATDLDTLTYDFVSAPGWMSIDSLTGMISGTPIATGTYIANVSVDDGTDIVYGILTVTVYDYQIVLTEGWNLISIPLVPEEDDTSIATVFNQIDEKVNIVWSYTYDETSGDGENVWKYNEFDGTSWMPENSHVQNIIPGYGYYINMSGDATIYLNGNRMYDNDGFTIPKPPVVTLASSWNLIGHYGTVENLPKADALDTLGDSYSTLLDKEGHSVLNMNPKEGYWLFIKGTNSLDYAPSDEAYP